jgi:hypothetical protein
LQNVAVRTFRSALAGLTASAKATASPPKLRAKAEGRLLHPFCNALLEMRRQKSEGTGKALSPEP